MKTKFYTLPNTTPIKKKKETTFTSYISIGFVVKKCNESPNQWKNCLHIGLDYTYGDVFKCWDDEPNSFTIYFGVKGDEFDDMLNDNN